jgi:hypothetical protein
MKHKNIIPIALVVCVIAIGAFILFKNHREKEYTEYVGKTNEEVISIMDGYVPEIKELFYRNKEVFIEEISKDTPSDTIIIDNEKVSIYIEDISTLVKNAVYFKVNSTIGTKGSVFYSISIVFIQDEIFDEHIFNSRFECFVKLDSNWYIYKEFNWGV